MAGMSSERWPELPAGWKDTYAALHMWTQVAGKVALATAPPPDHSWGSALQITARGLTTRPLAHGNRAFALEFDFPTYQLHITASDGAARSLRPQTAAAFYHQEFGEVLLPYAAVRIADDPDAALEAFIVSTCRGAAALANWERTALERPTSR